MIDVAHVFMFDLIMFVRRKQTFCLQCIMGSIHSRLCEATRAIVSCSIIVDNSFQNTMQLYASSQFAEYIFGYVALLYFVI